ncbi:hypothetical protein G6F46_008068 [Rhizopus delemar]|uniref:Uncharacterized protein n=3 Tax=Rhizopus TaxID=4842 RepID=I1C1M9_RHIO9|nr:hypothetical protein RO3G_07064 [Rhizopus delemar RA 99-880]KAG1452646.1 hypothetical protein G6F55_008564 [Rhizopus delemar]KAG1540646.1 hypothetical protein G6F51_008397 [Rhizopus arrhizus]KAG1492050.1 hypothetical protein G6F54_009586 [Rhizopus delemar]KAG1506351.1 hypothetical protein G6F53_009752 [Rhizopus delemar]|eukprot:EIE82359.1 hypothetical protein RO3G_07064 [Rhizopus delemar RA 99-880]
MESTERWTTKKPSSSSLRDKELQRIKSLAVVSVLNKTFADTEPSQVITKRSSELNFSAELQGKYQESLKQLAAAKEQNDQQSQLLLLQEALVQALSEQIEYLTFENEKLLMQRPQLEQEDTVRSIRQTLDTLVQDDWQDQLVSVHSRLEETERRIGSVERAAHDLQQETQAQTVCIETKVETLMDRLKEKEDMVDKLYYEQQLSSLFPQPSSSSRSSLHSTSSHGQKPATARLKSIPAPAPPPSAPLPPIPTHPVENIPVIASRHMSISSRPVSSAFSEPVVSQVYYKEFTEQLQQRLSMSKEMDDLSLWTPNDYDEIQRKIESKDWLEDQQKGAFWKGMKKKLRV